MREAKFSLGREILSTQITKTRALAVSSGTYYLLIYIYTGTFVVGLLTAGLGMHACNGRTWMAVSGGGHERTECRKSMVFSVI